MSFKLKKLPLIFSLLLLLLFSFLLVNAEDKTNNSNFFSNFDFNFNFDNFLSFFKFWETEKPNLHEKTKKINDNNKDINLSKLNNKTRTILKNNNTFTFVLGSKIYKEDELKKSINSNSKLNEYIKGFNYDCISMDTGKEKLTFNFNTKLGKIDSINKGISCENKIKVKNDLFNDLSENGFSAKNIKTYLEKVDLPYSMYFKAIKVFTVG